MKELPVCEDLIDLDGEIKTWKFCAPVFIACAFFGIIIEDEENLVPEKFDNNFVRNGTMTFISYKEKTFALTCRHVLDSLEKKQIAWKKDQTDKFGYEPPIEGFHLFIPRKKVQHHFKFKLFSVPVSEDGYQPDVAIARVTLKFIEELEREPMEMTEIIKENQLQGTGIASGYPEQQRTIQEGSKLNTFSPKFVTCTATLQETRNGNILIEDNLKDHNGLDVLSGMSGGPIIWSDENQYGLAGIVREGFDIQPKEGQLRTEIGLSILGERITPAHLERWIDTLPELSELEDRSKMLIIPSGMSD